MRRQAIPAPGRWRPLLIVAIAWQLGAAAWVDDPLIAQQPQSQQQPPPAKPAVPLFPRHRRGLYKNGQGLEVMDFTPQSPPLATDDPSVPDRHAYEINFTTFADHAKGETSLDLLLIDANYGVEPRLFGRTVPTQVKFEFPIAAVREGDEPFRAGAGAAIAGLKFNVFEDERTGLAFSIYPQVEFSLPGSQAVEKGLAEAGQTIILPVLASKQFKYATLVLNAGLHVPVHDPARDVTTRFSFGWGLPLRRKLAVMAEVSLESAAGFGHDRLVVINAGVMRGFGRNVILYGNVGRSVFADAGPAHTYAGVGLKIVAPRW